MREFKTKFQRFFPQVSEKCFSNIDWKLYKVFNFYKTAQICCVLLHKNCERKRPNLAWVFYEIFILAAVLYGRFQHGRRYLARWLTGGFVRYMSRSSTVARWWWHYILVSDIFRCILYCKKIKRARFSYFPIQCWKWPLFFESYKQNLKLLLKMQQICEDFLEMFIEICG